MDQQSKINRRSLGYCRPMCRKVSKRHFGGFLYRELLLCNQEIKRNEIGIMVAIARNICIYLVLSCMASQGFAQVIPQDGIPIPHSMLKDDTGEIIGPIVGFHETLPLVLLSVDDNKALVLFTNRPALFGHLRVYYSEPDCGGNVVGINDSESYGRDGLYTMQSHDYGIGKGNILYRDIKGTLGQRHVESYWKGVTQDTLTSPHCVNESVDIVFREAEVVDDLDNLYVPPFHIE